MTTPFVEAPQAYPGLQPSGVRQSPETVFSKRLWIGRAELGLCELPSPRYSTAPNVSQSRGESAHALIGGGTATHLLPNKARTWTFAWPRLTRAQFDLLDALQSRDADLFGNGPWAMLNPEGRNRLTRAQSKCLDASQWITASGTVATDATKGYIRGSGSLLWTPAASGKVLGAAGSLSGGLILPDVSRAPVHVSAEPFTVSFWCQAPSGSVSVSARVVGKAATGSAITTITGSAVTVGTGWQMVSVVAAPGAFDPTCLYLIPELGSNDGLPVRFSNPSATYTAETVDWGPGGGVPRVVLTTGVPREIAVTLESDGVALTFAEHIIGVS